MMTYISYDLKFSFQLKVFNPNIFFQSLVRQTEMSIRGRRHKKRVTYDTKNTFVTLEGKP